MPAGKLREIFVEKLQAVHFLNRDILLVLSF